MTTGQGYFVDSNLLVLLVVGSEGRELIASHRRLRDFSGADYDLLLDVLRRGGQIYVTPNTLTEASNLLGQHGEPERSRLFRRFRSIIEEGEEVVVASAVAMDNAAFERLGLTDAVLLQVITTATPLLTMDWNLYLVGWEQKPGAAVNFRQLRAP